MQQYFSNILKDEYFVLSNEDLHHIKDVMRFKNKDNVLVAYQSELYLCELLFAEKSIMAKIIKKMNNKPELPTKITLIYGIPKGDKFEFVIQKATELGVSKIVPFECERAIVKIDDKKVDKKLERWNKIIKEAAEQSHRVEIPSICKPIHANELKDYLSELNICGSEEKCGEGSKKLFDLLIKTPKSISVIVGPEGGFSHQEFELFEKLEYKNVSFGNRILRSETACLYILSILGFVLEKGDNND